MTYEPSCEGLPFAMLRNCKSGPLPYSALEQHREFMARFGSGMKPVEAVATSGSEARIRSCRGLFSTLAETGP